MSDLSDHGLSYDFERGTKSVLHATGTPERRGFWPPTERGNVTKTLTSLEPLHAPLRPKRLSPQLILFGYVLFLCFVVFAQHIASTELQTASMVVTAAVCLAILYMIPRVGWISYGGLFTLWTIVGIILKWCVGGTITWPTTTAYHYANLTLATEVFAAFALAFGATYVLTITARSGPPRRHRLTTTHASHELATSPTFGTGAFAVGLLLVMGRYIVGKYFLLGIPGAIPIALPYHSSGVIELATQYGPLAIAACLLWSAGLSNTPSSKRAYPAIILILYAIVGSVLGWRSYALDAAIVWFSTISLAQGNLVTPEATRPRRTNTIELALIAVLVLAGVSVALVVRPSGIHSASGQGGAFSFLFNRVGGLDYLAPAVGATQTFGIQHALLDPGRWSEFLKVTVYGYPENTTTGVAGTATGWLFASLGWLGATLGGALLGFLSGLVDRPGTRRPNEPRIRSLYRVGMYLAWLELLTEGTPDAALKTLLAFVVAIEIARLAWHPSSQLRRAHG